MPSIKSKTKPASWTFDAIGTAWRIDIFDASDTFKLQAAVAECIELFDKTYSRFRPDSWVTQLSLQAGTYDLPTNAAPLLRWYRQLYEMTDGAVTPLVGQALSDAGYDATYSLQPGDPQPAPDWDEVLHISDTSLTTSAPILLDFGAAGKGYLIDLLADVLHDNDVRSFCIDGSGDLLCRQLPEPLKIGLENPYDTSQVIGVHKLQNGALCGSAGNRRTWGDWHHIIDARTAHPASNIVATWVTADSAMVADGLATALFFSQPAAISSAGAFGFARLDTHGSLTHSNNFKDSFFTE